ncbi:NADH dehydrogenase [ubiquinone] 1 alpha subcomplex assembly factor 4-like [Haliotis cracherodii]|uniref:NADH dehydrogenase [ubiquinone] 1 alpha subcomplex assembly factor 4-like n=1 Tax=Haliotis rufescens TaxID=6454 RepID=UPI001EB01F2C|nr:NADH dehydrogenase [ubiquinone] 1 alpha subcomplex assembly factor 4-like [Haliotis rufescens]
MGRAVSKMSRPLKNFNVENRAHRAIDKQGDQPKVAPRYPSSAPLLDKFADDHPEYLTAQKTKHGKLVDNMRKLQLDSHGPPPEIKSKPRPKPESRDKLEDPEFGFLEPERIPAGRTSIRQAMQFITQHQSAPQDYKSSQIAHEYKLDEVHVQQILKYFQTFHMHLPKALLDKHPKLMDSLGRREPVQIKGGDSTMLKASSETDGTKV